MPARRLGRPEGQILEHAGGTSDGDQQHHADQEGQGIEVLPGDGPFLVQYAGQQHQRGAEQSDDRAVQPIQGQDGVGRQQQRQ